MLEKNKNCGFQIQWEKSDYPSLAFIAGFVRTTGSQAARTISDVVAMVRKLAPAFDAVYGEVRSMRDPKWSTPIDLKLRLPDIPAIAIYGQPYIDLFGIDKFESAPVVNVEAIGDRHYLIQSVSSADEPVPPSVRRSVREHFGEDAFMADGRWRYQSGMAPTFNLSGLLSTPKHLH